MFFHCMKKVSFKIKDNAFSFIFFLMLRFIDYIQRTQEITLLVGYIKHFASFWMQGFYIQCKATLNKILKVYGSN